MRTLFAHTRFATCIPEDLGGSGNPAPMTAAGVVCAMEAALAWLGRGGLAAKRIAVQGAGNVSAAMIPLLLERGVGRIVASETSEERRAALLDAIADPRLTIRRVEPGDVGILAEPCDVLAPNALGGVLGPKTIPELQTRLVCGAANNVLEDDARDGSALAARGIALVPDFIANRLGIVACCDEEAGRVHPDPRIEAQLGSEDPHGIRRVVERVLARARDAGETPVAAANALADAAMEEPHPIHGDRCRRIVASLVEGGWAEQAPFEPGA
jgi:glutamate dehydrogenase/leucine dehydrogenase